MARTTTNPLRQMGVGLTDDLKGKLEQAANAAGHSIGEEIRKRLEATFAETKAAVEEMPELWAFVRRIGALYTVIKSETGLDPFGHPAALAVLERALALYFEGLKTQPPLDGEPVFVPGDLPRDRLIQSTDLQNMAIAYEAIAAFQLDARDKGKPPGALLEAIQAELAKQERLK